ncbi:MAG: hypothetical protein R3Y63_00395 [Eubacteriales bacterium]
MKKIGTQTIAFASAPSIIGRANVVGKKEGAGPLASSFDLIGSDDTFGTESWEKAESSMQKQAMELALQRAGSTAEDLDFIFAGDLLNQCIGSSFAMRDQKVPFFGLYGACSTMGEGLILGAMTLDGNFANQVAVSASSHFCTAERQYRTPLEYGGQRTPTAQWTVTGAGAVVLGNSDKGPYITHATVGKITDKGITDTNNMGAAMAPDDVILGKYKNLLAQISLEALPTLHLCLVSLNFILRKIFLFNIFVFRMTRRRLDSLFTTGTGGFSGRAG